MFIAITLNHFRAIKAWADAHRGTASMDMSSFVLEVKARNRYYKLYPQFISGAQGRMSHVTVMTPEATAFIGWRPYQPLRCSLSSDKLVFKRAIAASGLPTPSHWPVTEAAGADFVLKRSVGSFGYQLAGPFRQAQQVPPTLPAALTDANARGDLYAETFVTGQNIKAWFWDGRPVHVQCQPYARIRGDGQSTVQSLLSARLADGGHDWRAYDEREAVIASLAYQGAQLDAVLPAGDTLWLDYRYGRRFTQEDSTESQDNAWSRLASAQQAQITRAGQWVAGAIKSEIKAPVLLSMDGVLDAGGTIWWLELNSNPICPPTAYFAMMASLFGTPAQAPAHAYARVVATPRRNAKAEATEPEPASNVPAAAADQAVAEGIA